VDDLIQGQVDLDHRIQALAKDIADLRVEVSKPTGNYASQDDLKKLADAIQEIDKKREADKELILSEMKKLGQVISAVPPEQSGGHRKKPTNSDTRGSNPTASNTSSTSNEGADQTGFYYKIKSGDSLSLIAQLYREQGIHVTTTQIQDANPNLLLVGTKIFIPAPKGSVLKPSKSE
jgi:LysM repeat protein